MHSSAKPIQPIQSCRASATETKRANHRLSARLASAPAAAKSKPPQRMPRRKRSPVEIADGGASPVLSLSGAAASVVRVRRFRQRHVVQLEGFGSSRVGSWGHASRSPSRKSSARSRRMCGHGDGAPDKGSREMRGGRKRMKRTSGRAPATATPAGPLAAPDGKSPGKIGGLRAAVERLSGYDLARERRADNAVQASPDRLTSPSRVARRAESAMNLTSAPASAARSADCRARRASTASSSLWFE